MQKQMYLRRRPVSWSRERRAVLPFPSTAADAEGGPDLLPVNDGEKVGSIAGHSAAIGSSSIGRGSACTVAVCGSGSSATLGLTSQRNSRPTPIERSSMIV
jgi:hypothetical protein